MHPTDNKTNLICAIDPSPHPLVRFPDTLLHRLQLLRAGQQTRHHPVTLVVLKKEVWAMSNNVWGNCICS